MVEGESRPMAASVWGLRGEEGQVGHHSQDRLWLPFSSLLWPCFHAQSFSSSENRPPPSCRGGQQEEFSGRVAGWSRGLWIWVSLLLIHIFNQSSCFQPCPSSYPRFLLSWFLSLCGVQRFGLGSFVGTSVWLLSFCPHSPALLPLLWSLLVFLEPVDTAHPLLCLLSFHCHCQFVLCIYCPFSWLEERMEFNVRV